MATESMFSCSPELRVDAEGPGGVVFAGVAREEAAQRGDRELARHLAAFVASHAVRDGVEAERGLGAEGVFVVAAATDGGPRRALEYRG